MKKLFQLILLLVVLAPADAQILQNPAFFFRVKKCSNIKATVALHETVLIDANCASLPEAPVYLNRFLQEKNNKLSFTITNQKANDFYGDFEYELLLHEKNTNTLKSIFTEILALEDGQQSSTPIDQLLKRGGWNFAFTNPNEQQAANILTGSTYEADKHAFIMSEKFWLRVSSSEYALFELLVNDSLIMRRTRIDGIAPQYGPSILLNQVSRSSGQFLLAYDLAPSTGTFGAQLQVTVVFERPGQGEEVLMETLINCADHESQKKGVIDFTVPLQRKGFF